MTSSDSAAVQIGRWAWAVAGITLFLAAWTIASVHLGNSVLLPKPQSVVYGFIDLIRDGSLFSDIAASLKRVLGGFAIASVIAVPLALLMSFSAPAEPAVIPDRLIPAADPADRLDSDCHPLVWDRRPPELLYHRTCGVLSDLHQQFCRGPGGSTGAYPCCALVGCGTACLVRADLSAFGDADDFGRTANWTGTVVDGCCDR